MGFFGNHTLAFVIMVAIIRKLMPSVFFHENTRNFDYDMLATLLPKYRLHHTFLKPAEYGCPASRTRSYCALVREDFELVHGLDEFYRMTTLTHPSMDCGVFCVATDDEALAMFGIEVVKCPNVHSQNQSQ